MSKWSFGDATLAVQSITENGISKKVAKSCYFRHFDFNFHKQQ